ncbi:MAG: hypothetical protein ACKVU4_02300 [Phycisphaerales bacterium]
MTLGLFVPVLAALLANGGPEPCGQGIPTFETGLAATAFRHVATNGSNATGNGTQGAPYATIAFAAGRAGPGTAIRVHPGTYAGGGAIATLHGTAAAPIWIGGVPGQPRPVLHGGANGLQLVGPRYVVLHDLEVRNATGNGINCDDGGQVANPEAARFLVCRGLFIHDIGGTGNQDGLKLSGINDFHVLDCVIERTGGGGSGSGVDMVGCHRGVIARCGFKDMSANAVQAKGGSEDVEVRWCRIEKGGGRGVNIGGSTGFEFFRPPLSAATPNTEARNIRVVANLFIGGDTPVAFVGCVDSLVANNTIITPNTWLLRVLQETVTEGGFTFLACGNNRFENNLVYYSRSELSTPVNIGGNTAAATFQFAHNLWYAWDNPALSQPTLPVPEVNGVVALDPSLLDPGTGQFAIGENSPAAGAGRHPAGAAGDFVGACYRSPPSIGAYEHADARATRTPR